MLYKHKSHFGKIFYDGKCTFSIKTRDRMKNVSKSLFYKMSLLKKIYILYINNGYSIKWGYKYLHAFLHFPNFAQ